MAVLFTKLPDLARWDRLPQVTLERSLGLDRTDSEDARGGCRFVSMTGNQGFTL